LHPPAPNRKAAGRLVVAVASQAAVGHGHPAAVSPAVAAVFPATALREAGEMEYLCTTCSKRKRREVKPLPALERYVSGRIRWVWQESRREDKPFLILSGKHDLLAPHQKISWYDHALQSEEVEALAGKIKSQLTAYGVSQVTFYALPKNTLGWRPYYEAVEKACAHLGIKLRCKILRGFI
jgi:hypothetical protein